MIFVFLILGFGCLGLVADLLGLSGFLTVIAFAFLVIMVLVLVLVF